MNADSPNPQSLDAELERLAESFGMRNYKLAGSLFEKILQRVHPVAPKPLNQDPNVIPKPDGWVELRKAARAISDQNFSLASNCLRKAMTALTAEGAPAGLTVTNPTQAQAASTDFVRAVTSTDPSMMEASVRRLRDCFQLTNAGQSKPVSSPSPASSGTDPQAPATPA